MDMRAVVIVRPGGPDALELRRVAVPEPGAGRIRVRVEAAGLNRADLSQRAGRYPAPDGWPADIPGLEYAGIVDALGSGVDDWRPGDRVMGLVGGGAHAELVLADAAEAVRIPDRLDSIHAAAVPEIFITAHDALFTQAGLRAGERLLIHAVGSGVGTAALQLAKAAGAFVFGTARSAWKLERAASIGLDRPIDASREDFADVIGRETGGAGVDVILDLVGGDYLAANLRSIGSRGRVMLVGLVAGAASTLDMRLLLRKRVTIRGTVLRSRAPDEKAAVAAAFRTHVLPLLEAATIAPVIDRVFPFDEVRAAHAHVQADRSFGKVVLSWAASRRSRG